MSDELSALAAYSSVGGRTCYQLLFCPIYENFSPLPLQVTFPALNFLHNHFFKKCIALST